MNNTSRIITGIVAIAIGIGLITLGFWEFPAFFYGIPILLIGFFILTNKDEDKIEEVREK